MNDPQPSVSSRQNGFRDFLSAYYDDSGYFDDMPSATDGSAGLVSLGFIGSVLRRGRTVWLTIALIGLVAGAGLALYRLDRTPAYTATTTVLIDAAGNSQGTEMPTDASIAQSTQVAAAVVAQLGIPETPADFLGSYTATAATATTILTITAKAPDADSAVQRANAIATQFLAFRAKYLQAQLAQTIGSLNQGISQAQQNLNSIEKQINQLSAEPQSANQTAQLSTLRAEQTDAANNLSTVKQNASSSQLQAQTSTAQLIHGSEVLSAATPTKRSAKKTVALYAGGFLVGGLAVGMAIVVIGGITTDRLRRRDDIAIAVGAPVKLSVGPLRLGRRVPGLRTRSRRRNHDMARVLEHLQNVAAAHPRRPVGLAVVATDDAATVAQLVTELATANSQQHKRVVLADLSTGNRAARRLGITDPGIGAVSLEGASIAVVVPEAEDVAPIGPLGNPPPGSAQVMQGLAETCADADLILSIVTLNPAFGSDYLRTWATDAVIVVTAGESTATRLNAAGEMIRLAGTRLASVVLLDADKSDESLGTVTAEYRPAAAVRE